MYLPLATLETTYPRGKKIGEGITSRVYQSGSFALKWVKTDTPESTIQAGLTEIDIYSRIDANLLPLIAWSYSLDPVYLVLVFPLGEALKAQLSPKSVVEGVLSAMTGLYQVGLGHNDIKVANLLMYNNQVRLIDFGLISPLCWQDQELCLHNPASTINFRDPEISIGHVISLKSELYSVGAVLAQLYTDINPTSLLNYPLSPYQVYTSTHGMAGDLDVPKLILDLIHYPLSQRLTLAELVTKYGLTLHPTTTRPIIRGYSNTQPVNQTRFRTLAIWMLEAQRGNQLKTYFIAMHLFHRCLALLPQWGLAKTHAGSDCALLQLVASGCIILAQMLNNDRVRTFHHLKYLNFDEYTIQQFQEITLHIVVWLKGQLLMGGIDASLATSAISTSFTRLITYPFVATSEEVKDYTIPSDGTLGNMSCEACFVALAVQLGATGDIGSLVKALDTQPTFQLTFKVPKPRDTLKVSYVELLSAISAYNTADNNPDNDLGKNQVSFKYASQEHYLLHFDQVYQLVHKVLRGLIQLTPLSEKDRNVILTLLGRTHLGHRLRTYVLKCG